MARTSRKFLWRALGEEVPWARRLVVGMCNYSLAMRSGKLRRGVVALARVVDGYRGLERLRRREGIERKPDMVVDYENYCAEALRTFEPPIPTGACPVDTLCRVAAKLPRKRRSPPSRTIDALDALISAGQGAPDPLLERRVVEQLARMLGARVLLHKAGGRFLRLEPQSRHTLGTWSLHRLLRCERVVARRVRRRPEFWRPEQRRPRGLLSFPIGQGVCCLARQRAFRRQEVRAVETVLRFLAARGQPGGLVPALAPTSPSAPARRGRMKGLVGHAPAWTRVMRQVWRVAPNACSVLLRGETGTGKELVARALHFGSARAGGPFVALNCAALNRDTYLSELFGHVRGAFTGAVKTREGLVRRAHRGTLFLDELGDLPAEMQVALLRVLQERKVRAVGSVRDVPVDVRILAATNQDLDGMVERGTFRLDLLHRLNVVEVELPPLRQRMEDLSALVGHVLGRRRITKQLHMDTLAKLAGYAWPGNVRELDNVLQAAALLSDGAMIEPAVVERILEDRRRADRPPPGLRMAPRAGQIMARLSQGWWSAPDLAVALGVSARTVNRELARLLEEGRVERYGEARAARYREQLDPCRDPSGTGAD